MVGAFLAAAVVTLVQFFRVRDKRPLMADTAAPMMTAAALNATDFPALGQEPNVI